MTTQPPGAAANDVIDSSDGAIRHERVHWRRLLQRKLLIRVTVPTLIGLVQVCFAIVAIANDAAPPRILLWALPALLVGYLFGRSTKLAWDDEGVQIVLIRAQLLLTVAYIALRVIGHIVLEQTLGGRMGLADVLLVLSFGLYVGRTLGLTRQIRRALSGRSTTEGD